MDAAGLEEVVRSANVRFEGRQRTAQRRVHDRLRAEVENGIDLVLADGSFNRLEVLEAAIDDGSPVDVAAADQLALRIPVAHQRDDPRSLVEKPLDQPR